MPKTAVVKASRQIDNGKLIIVRSVIIPMTISGVSNFDNILFGLIA